MREAIKDYSGFVIGYIDRQANGDEYGYDRFNRPCGSYIKYRNETVDRFNWPVAKGNILTSLIYQAEQTNK